MFNYNGKLITTAEEERFNRVKHWARFPMDSIKCHLKQSNLRISDIHHLSINIDSKANHLKKDLFKGKINNIESFCLFTLLNNISTFC